MNIMANKYLIKRILRERKKLLSKNDKHKIFLT